MYTRVKNVWGGWPLYEVKSYVPEGRNERRSVATPTNFPLIFDSYDYSGYDVFTGFKVEMTIFQSFYEMKLKTSMFKVLAF